MNIKGAIFDMDGTLIDSLGFWEVLWEKVGEKYLGDKGFTPAAEDEKAVRTMIMEDAVRLLFDHYDFGDSYEELLDFANGCLLNYYLNDVQVKPGVTEYLDYLKSQGVDMIIASATAPKYLDIAVKKCGFEKYFSEILSCSTLGLGKDKPDIFLLAMEHLGTKKEETWIFEDSLTALETAAKAGMNTVGIYDSHTSNQQRIEEVSSVYISANETLAKLIG